MDEPQREAQRSVVDSLTTLAAWVAAVGGVIAAIAAILSAFFTHEQVTLEDKPVLVLTGHPEFYGADRIDHIAPPSHVFFTEPDASRMLELSPSIPTYAFGGRMQLPQLFSHFTVTNAGRLTLVNIAMPITVSFYKNNPDGSANLSPISTEDEVITIPQLAPQERYDFAIANAAAIHTSFKFSRFVRLTRVDSEQETSVHLFADDEVAHLEAFVNNGTAKPLTVPPEKPQKHDPH